MNAVALLHPDVPAEAVFPFQKSCSNLQIVPGLSSAQRTDAAIIFGGDGTVHRYLPELHEYKIPTLVFRWAAGMISPVRSVSAA